MDNGRGHYPFFKFASELAYKRFSPIIIIFLTLTTTMKLPRLKLTIPSGIILLALFFDFFLAISLPYFEFVYVVETSFISNNTKQEVLAIESSQKLTQLSVSLAKLLPTWLIFLPRPSSWVPGKDS